MSMNRRTFIRVVGGVGLTSAVPFRYVFGAEKAALATSGVLVEAASFAELGGWKLDTQHYQQMGGCYLLAHGMGKPVANARTTVKIPAVGHMARLGADSGLVPRRLAGARSFQGARRRHAAEAGIRCRRRDVALAEGRCRRNLVAGRGRSGTEGPDRLRRPLRCDLLLQGSLARSSQRRPRRVGRLEGSSRRSRGQGDRGAEVRRRHRGRWDLPGALPRSPPSRRGSRSL